MDWVEIGARIRTQRDQFGYTREAFAEILDITPKFCADIELGNKGMSVQTLCNISSVLKLSTDYILFGTSQQEHAFSSLLLQRCTPVEQKYAEEILKTFLVAMDSKRT
jgi:transcriptional regulator with XRE-family HTH domain